MTVLVISYVFIVRGNHDNYDLHNHIYNDHHHEYDGTLVCTTYGHWEKGKSPYILSARFKMETLDKMMKSIKEYGQTVIINDMGKNVLTYNPDVRE